MRVGVLGLTNPGIAIWDKANVEGKLRFTDLVESAKFWVPVIRAFGADVVLGTAAVGRGLHPVVVARQVSSKSSTTVNTNTVPEDPKIVSLMAEQHDATVVFPAGQVTIRDIPRSYIYDNTLEAVTMTGAR